MHRDAIGLRSLVEGAGIRLLLGRHVRVDLAPHDPGIRQHQQAVDEHFAAAVKALGKGFDAAFTVDQLRPLAEIDVREQCLVAVIVSLSRQQRGGQGIAHGADADLQGAAIAHQRAGMQANEVILKTHRHVRRGEQRGAVFLVNQQVEGINAHFRVAGHVRQVVVHLSQQQNRLPCRTALGDHRQQVEGDVRVAAQAQAVGMLAVTGHQLRHQVQAGGVDVPGGVTVVAADVILLRRCAVEQAARLQEELLDANVRRQVVLVQTRKEIQFRIVAEHPFDEGFQEALLQAVA
ncbi:hypothetical protein D3C87_1430710 [compost metagenome]